MDDFKSLITNFISQYDKPIINIKYLGRVYYSDRYILEGRELGDSDIEFDEVDVKVNGFSDPVKYYELLSSTKQKIIENLWNLQEKNSKIFSSTLNFTVGLLKNSLNNFYKEGSEVSLSYLPSFSPKWFLLKDLIYNHKEEKFYTACEKRSQVPVITNERIWISFYYHFMMEILEELILFMESVQTIKKERKSIESFELSFKNQSLADFKNSLVSKGFIEEIENKSFSENFHGGIVKHKINWIDGIESLSFFIKECLVKKGFVLPVSEKWKITAKCFSIDNEEIDTDRIATQHKPPERTQEAIQNCFKNLKKRIDSNSNI